MGSSTVGYDGKVGPATKRMKRPTFGQNLNYFINYQLVHMYFRYFMWNFAGRQNDLQGNGEVNRGNWISGIPAIDNARLGDQSLLPPDQGRDNKGHNVFYMLPLLLGVAGLLWQSMRGQRGIEQFWVVFFLFFMTGIAIVLYLNQTPSQPRERDYAYAGSFYAFAIWIGLGVGAIAEGLESLLKKKDSTAAGAIASVIGLIVPLQMVSQTWDDHDRSGRYTARDFGMNYLSSLDENVRVINLSYLTTDWYAEQQRLPSYQAAPVPMTATALDLANGRRQSGYLMEADTVVPVSDFLRHYYSSEADMPGMGYAVDVAGSISFPVDIDAAVAAGRISPEEAAHAADTIEVDMITALKRKNQGQSIITQGDVLTYDILAAAIDGGWKRPVYFANTVPDSYYLGLQPYMYTTGMAQEVIPVYNADQIKEANTEKAYRNVMERFRWGGLDAEDSGDVYLDETVKRMLASTRNAMLSVASSLIAEGQSQKALDVLMTMDTKLPMCVMPYGVQVGDAVAYYMISLGEQLANDQAIERGEEILRQEIMTAVHYIPYIRSLTPARRATLQASDRAMVEYGDYSYIFDLIVRYVYSVGADSATDYLNEVRDKTGVDLIRMFNLDRMDDSSDDPEVAETAVETSTDSTIS